MTAALRALDDPQSRWGRRAVVAGLLVLAYVVAIGDAGLPDPVLVLRVLHAVVAGTAILAYLLVAPSRADRVDIAVLIALLLFAAAGVLAEFPRQAFDGVLTALLFAAAFFLARRMLRADLARRRLALCLIFLSAVITFVTAATWITTFFEWWSLTDWTVVPPLNMDVFGGPWGHRHDLALLVVMLFPAWFLLPMNPLRTAGAIVTGVLVGIIVIIDGSRTIWLAVTVASVALALMAGRRSWLSEPRRQVLLAAAVFIGLAALVVSGAMTFLVERALASESFDLRLVMWRALVEAWVESPLAGYGPGSFPWTLQLTDYFDVNTLAPRHPDNAGFQLLGEAGILGLAGLVVLAVVLAPAVYRGGSRAAVWALLVFAVASLGQNPTDFIFLVALAIAWTAFAIPHASGPARGDRQANSWPRWVSIAALIVVAAAWTSTAVGDVVYGSARDAIDEEDWRQSSMLLASAETLDPGMGLYARQHAAVRLLDGDPDTAASLAAGAARRTPSDDLSWRVLALSSEAAGDREGALGALESALEAQRSDPTNLLLLARLQVTAGDPAARETLAEIAQAWPEVVNAYGWTDLLPAGTHTRDVLQDALDRWAAGSPSPDPLADQPVLLAAMSGNAEQALSYAHELIGPTLGPAAVAVLTCHPNARELLDKATDQDRRGSLYWMLMERQAALEGEVDVGAARLLEIMTGRPRADLLVDHALNPLNENGRGYTADMWGYRRTPVGWPDYELLPDPEAGAARLRVEPRGAVQSAGLEAELPACVSPRP